jgi:putative ABC transport system substrate-binding protein
MRRREFLGAIATVACARPSLAQQSLMPVVGFLRNTSSDEAAHLVAAFNKGLGEAGYADGRNVRIEYRWTHGKTERLPAMAADLVGRQVNVIVALGNTAAVRAAKSATATIPIVFMLGTDPVELGLIESLNHPGGNATGVINLNLQLAQKWLEVLHELIPSAFDIALLVNPQNRATTDGYFREIATAAQRLGLRIHVLQASAVDDFEAAFARIQSFRARALIVVADLLFISNIQRLAALSVQHKLPAIFPFREFAAAGGLISYGTDLADTYRLAGVYTGRILRGEKPESLPVQQATKVEMIINLKTAKELGIEVPPLLLARANEVIE